MVEMMRDDDESESREIVADASTVGALNRSDVEAQLAAAHRYPRSIKRFLVQAQELATLTTDVAESCIYSVERAGDMISGPSVRLAEIVAGAWRNLQIGARVVSVDDTAITSQGVAWDMENNVRVAIETRRRITKRDGRRYNEDGITNAGNAASSIALRNAVFRIIPGAYVQIIFDKAKAVAVGDAETLSKRRVEVVERLKKMGITPERIFARIGKAGIAEVGLEEVAVLIGLGTGIKNGERTIDEAFPPVGAGVTTAAAADIEKRIRDTPTTPETKAADPTPAAQPQPTAESVANARKLQEELDKRAQETPVAEEKKAADPWGLQPTGAPLEELQAEALELRKAILADAAKPSKAAEKAFRLRFDAFVKKAPAALAGDVRRFHAAVEGRRSAGQPLPPVDVVFDDPDDGPPPDDVSEDKGAAR